MNSRRPTGRIAIDDGQQPIGLAAGALAVLLAALWGGTPVAVKFSTSLLGPITVSGVRFAMASVFMLFWCRWQRTGIRLRPGQVMPSLILGLLLFVQIVLFTVGIHWSNASHGTLFVNTFIFWVVGFDHFLTRGSRLTPRRLLGLFVAALAVVLILSTTKTAGGGEADVDSPDLLGDLLLVASAFVLGIKIIYTKHAMRVVESGKLIFWHDVIGVVCFAVTAAIFEQPNLQPFVGRAVVFDKATREAMLGLLYQGVVVAGFCFATQAVLLRRHSATQLSVFSFTTPLFGITFAVLMRGETLSEWLVVSGVCVAVGILLVNLPEKKRNGPAAPGSRSGRNNRQIGPNAGG